MRTVASSPSGKVALVTMGGQAQVVTFAVDGLLAMGEPLSQVLVLHLSSEDLRVRQALAQLSAEFAGGQYRGHSLEFRRIPLQALGRPLTAITGGAEAEAVWALARDLLAELKEEGRSLHLCIAGGPRLLALTLTTAAMLHCDHQDRLWHLYTPPEFLKQAREGAILHAPPEAGVRLVPVPFAPWGVYFPALRALTRPPVGAPSLSPKDAACCAAVWKQLTDRQREVLRVLVSAPSLQDAAEQLGMTLKTLDSHKGQILAWCRVAWEMPDDAYLTYHFLREKFGPWLAVSR